jgi:hypothetical protein
MTGFSAAMQRQKSCACGIYSPACTRSENIELTEWARSRHPTVLLSDVGPASDTLLPSGTFCQVANTSRWVNWQESSPHSRYQCHLQGNAPNSP